jgi:hypothetical protein
MGFLRSTSCEGEEGRRRQGKDTILKRRILAFSLVAASTLGSVFKGQWGIDGGPLLDGILAACLVLGLFLWMASKRMESIGRRQRRQENEEEQAP